MSVPSPVSMSVILHGSVRSLRTWIVLCSRSKVMSDMWSEKLAKYSLIM